jgi:hypothetical protein
MSIQFRNHKSAQVWDRVVIAAIGVGKASNQAVLIADAIIESRNMRLLELDELDRIAAEEAAEASK